MIIMYQNDRGQCYWSEFRDEPQAQGSVFKIRENCLMVELIIFDDDGRETERRVLNSEYKKGQWSWFSRMMYE